MAHDDPDQRARELEVLAESSALLTSTLDLHEVLDRLAVMARTRIGVDAARIWLLDDTGEHLELQARTGAMRSTVEQKPRLSARDAIAGWVIAHKQPLRLADVLDDPRLVNREWFLAEGFVSLLAVPIMLDDHPMGMLGCLSRTRREFSEADVALARALTAPAVAALRNAALYADALARVEEIEAFQRVASETLSSPDLETALRAVVRELRDLLRSDAALCTHVDSHTGRLRMLTSVGTRTTGIPGYRVTPGEGVSGLLVQERRSVRSDEYLADPRFTRSPEVEAWGRAEGIASIIGAPVIDTTGEIIAFLWAFNRTARPFTARHEVTVTGLAQQAALAIAKAQSFEDERRRARQTTALLEIARACTSTLELLPLLKRIALSTAQAVGVDACAIFLWNGSRLAPVMAQFADGRPDSVLWERFKALTPHSVDDAPAHGEAIRTRQPVIIAPDGPWMPDTWFRAFDLASALVVPLVAQDQVVGTVSLVQQQARRFQQDQLDLAMTIAAQVALAVHTARHYAAAQQHAAEVETLAAIGETLTSTLDLQRVLEAIAESAATLLRAPRAAVFELDQAAKCVRARANRGFDIAPGLLMPLGQGAAGAATELRRPVWRADAIADPLPGADQIHEQSGVPIGALAAKYGFRGILAVPVVNRDIPLGAVCIFWEEVHEPDEREIGLLTALARQAAIAMDNARLVGDLRRTLDDLRAAQETLVRGATLRAVGELAAGAAHHLNNLMAVVLGRAQLLLMKQPDGATTASLRSIERAAADAADTVVRIQSFSRTEKRGEAAPFDLNLTVQEAIEFTRSRWQDEAQVKGAPIECAFERGTLPAISGRGTEIREVMANLILNAVDALPAGGRIAVRTRGEAGRAVVTVTDSGLGMSSDVKRRAFEPFFTTKGVKRTGLGLAVAYGTIRRHGGQVEIESEEGRGTTVTFWLPVSGAPKGDASAADGDRYGSILVIDDEADVRELVADVLTGRGHTVAVAAGGREGLSRFETGRYDLVVTDLGMPDLTGWEVARAIKASRADVPVLLLTGWADAVSPSDAARVDGVVKKPFDLKHLATVVTDALSSRPAA
jgi:GAF domain-containing protein/anti-sigma regulatory factor (Ser/Thr protein kinase)